MSNFDKTKEQYKSLCLSGNLEDLKKIYSERNWFKPKNAIYYALLRFAGAFNVSDDLMEMEYAGLSIACKHNHKNIVDFLINDVRLNNRELLTACCLSAISVGNIDIGKMLASQTKDTACFNEWTYLAFEKLCEIGNLDAIKYLLTDKILNVPVDDLLNHAISGGVEKHNGFIKACEAGHIDIVKYLIGSHELTSHIDLLEIQKEIKITSPEILRYFIQELNLPQDHNLIKNISTSDPYLINTLYDKRKLYEDLTDYNYESKSTKKRVKI